MRRSWAHPCCLLTSSELGGLNPHTRIGSPQALSACWTPNSRFNLPPSFTFINRRLFFFSHQLTLPNDNHCDSLLFFFFFLRTGLLDFREWFSVAFFSLLYFTLLRLFSPCSCGLSAESAKHQHQTFACEQTVSASSLLTVWECGLASPDML